MSKPMFNVGDRVEAIDYLFGGDTGEQGVVGEVRDRVICIHFDNPKLERIQYYPSGWNPKRFKLVDNPADFEPDLDL